MTVTQTLRNASLSELATILKDQAGARYDIVAHSANLEFRDGNLIVKVTGEPVLTAEGVTPAITEEVCLTPTDIFDSGISDRLGIPLKYVRRMRDGEKSDLLDHNVNTWLAESNKQWFVRGFKGGDEICGIARAFLSDRFGAIDNLDVLLAALAGIQAAGVDAKVVGADLSERRMSLRVVVPEVAALAPLLLADYRSPFGTGGERGRMYEALGHLPNGSPIVFAGFSITNSETGGSAFTITPQATVLACFNGMTFTKDAMRKVHLGSKMEEGEIVWSDETNRKQVELITSQAKDAVTTFCSEEFLNAKLAEIEGLAGAEVTAPATVVQQVSKSLGFSDTEAEGILGHFILGGQMTAGGVLNAITSFSQTITDPDRAATVNDQGLDALAEAHRLVLAG